MVIGVSVLVHYVLVSIGSQLLLASTSSIVLLGRGSEKTFYECLGHSLSIAFLSAALAQLWLLIITRWQVYNLVMLVGKAVQFYHRSAHRRAKPIY